MYDKLEINFLSFIKYESQGRFVRAFKSILKFLSFFYGIIIFLRNKAYDYKFFKTHKINVPAIISVGNIVVGGTGKTPVTLLLSREFLDLFPFAILSRGYRSEAEKMNPPLILSKGNGPEYSAEICGDEPFLLADNLKKAFIFVGRNRCKSAALAASYGAKLIILDDGMQHRKLARNYDVVVLDAEDPFGRNYMLPGGLLREHKSSLKRADLIIINHLKTKFQYQLIKDEIKKFTSSPTVGTEIKVNYIENFYNQEKITLKGKNIGFFCSLGNPFHFKETLKTLDVNIVDSLIFKDHGKICEKELSKFAENCRKKNAEYLICSEKDKVKLTLSLPIELPIAWIKIELTIVEDLMNWNSFIESTKNLVENSSY